MFGNSISKKNRTVIKDMNPEYYRDVADYMPIPLPKPSYKPNLVDEEGNRIRIITVTCEGREW